MKVDDNGVIGVCSEVATKPLERRVDDPLGDGKFDAAFVGWIVVQLDEVDALGGIDRRALVPRVGETAFVFGVEPIVRLPIIEANAELFLEVAGKVAQHSIGAMIHSALVDIVLNIVVA